MLGGPCPVEERRAGPTMYVTKRSIEVAQMRREIREEASPKDQSGAENLLFLAFLLAVGVLRRKVRGKQVERPHQRADFG